MRFTKFHRLDHILSDMPHWQVTILALILIFLLAVLDYLQEMSFRFLFFTYSRFFWLRGM
jgi:cell shape-determining protein MreD